jgi:hypothetical protein
MLLWPRRTQLLRHQQQQQHLHSEPLLLQLFAAVQEVSDGGLCCQPQQKQCHQKPQLLHLPYAAAAAVQVLSSGGYCR